MESHNTTSNTALYLLSKTFERAGFYGFRSVFLFYLIEGNLKLDRMDVYDIYGYVTSGIVVSALFGGLIGDLLLGSKKSMILGGLLQALGVFLFLIENQFGVMLGLILSVLGNGLYSPNLLASIGKVNLHSANKMDGVFTLYYLCTYLGAVSAPMLVAVLGEKNFAAAFLISGGLILLSSLLLLLTKDPTRIGFKKQKKFEINNALAFLLSFLCFGTFWGTYELYGNELYKIQMSAFQNGQLGFNTITQIPTFIICIVFTILWFIVDVKTLIKLMIGFVAAILACVLLVNIDLDMKSLPFAEVMTATIVLSFAEMLIGPMLYSLVAKNIPVKFMAIGMGILVLPTVFSSTFIQIFDSIFHEGGNSSFYFSIFAYSAVIVFLVFFYFLFKEKKEANSTENEMDELIQS